MSSRFKLSKSYERKAHLNGLHKEIKEARKERDATWKCKLARKQIN